MILPSQTEKEQVETKDDSQATPKAEEEKVLCPHCKRTATNGLKCKGICVADDDY